MTAPRLHPDDLAALAEMIADRLADRLAMEHRRGSDPVLIDAAEVARRFGLSAEWVRDHASDLGVIRLGDGPRPRLRFEPERVVAALTARDDGGTSEGEQGPVPAPIRRRRPAREAAGAPGLLPFDTVNSPKSEKRGPGAVAPARDQAERSEPSPRTEPTRPRQGSGGAGRAPRAESDRRP